MTRKPLAQPPPEEDPKQDVRELVRCMYSLDRELNRLNKDLAKIHSINPRSIYIMAQIRSGHNRPAELARHFGVLPSAITFEIDKLVAAKLVRRDQNPADRRSVVLSVTAKGLNVVERAVTATHTLLEERMSRVAPADLKTFLDVFKVLREAPPAGG